MTVAPSLSRPLASPAATAPLRAGLLGYGYWGPNLARNVAMSPLSTLATVADLDGERLTAAAAAHPLAQLTSDFRSVLTDPSIDAVLIATPPATHFELVKEAIECGKHVLVTKPIATSSAGAEELQRLAAAAGVTLMVDHTFLFTGAVRRMKEYLERDELGEVYYFDSIRINLGLFQSGTNVIWDLAPHDISILLHLLEEEPRTVSAVGACHVDSSVENIAYLTVRFDGPLLAHFHVNWLAPAKVRTLIVGGSRRMLVFDDMQASEKLKVYDAGARLQTTREDVYKTLVEYRTGDILCPRLDKTEALTVEWQHFVDVVRRGATPVSSAALGVKVVGVIEAAQASLRLGGTPVEVRS